VEAFSIGFGSEGAYMNELEHARTVARKYGMTHRSLIYEWKDLQGQLEKIAWSLDEPCGDPAAFLTLALSGFARERVTVALSGLGGDELFGGYRRYLAVKYHARYLKLPALVRDGVVRPILEALPEARTSRLANLARLAKKFALNVERDVKGSWARTTSYLPAFAGPLFEGDLRGISRSTYRSEGYERHWSTVAGWPDPLAQVMYMDMKMYLPDQLLHLQDRMSMAASLEARVPFMDHRLVEMAASIPSRFKIRGRNLKAVLKKLAERYVPAGCIYREKKGFTAPIEVWLRGPLREPLEECLSPERVKDRGIFNVAFVEWMKAEFFQRQRDMALPLYQAFLLELWMKGVGPLQSSDPVAPNA
jgi:asparagine synthase (glutamine-hydrolysing)